ncbi:MAG: transposase family protein [Deltaproteobacteria bacterium]|jgi:hypothetical protein|nr:transposase family protein [Deltaproteobacteria bacterium]
MDPLTAKVLKPELNPLFLTFETIYRIEFPLYIKEIKFDEEARKVDIFIEYHKKATFPCACGQTGQKIHSRVPRVWRGLDIANCQARLHLEVPRIKCANCGVKTYHAPWAREHSHFSRLFEERALFLAEYMPPSKVALFVGVNESQILRLLEQRGKTPKRLSPKSDEGA